MPVLIGLFLAYAGEIAQPTFHTDQFFEIWYRDNLLDYWTGYGRYLSKLIMVALGNLYPPTFLWLVGLAVLSCVGVLIASVWEITGQARVVLVIILCTFPFFLESFSYTPLRYAVPLSVACSIVAVMRGGAMGLLLAFGALMLYQAALYFAAVVVLVWAAVEAVKGRPWLECVKFILVPKLGILLAAIMVDTLMLRAVNAFVSPIGLFDYPLVSSAQELGRSLSLQLKAVASFFVEPGVFLFPLWTKLVGLAGLAASALQVVRKVLPVGNRVLSLAILPVLPFAAHGTVLIIYPPNTFLFERVLFGYAAVYLGIFAIAYVSAATERTRRAVVVVYALAGAGFIYEVNVWHEYLQLKNMADFDMARAISDRLKASSDYRPGLPLVMVGSKTPTDYLPYRAFHPKQGIIQDTIVNSAYTLDWSKDRILMFFVPFAWPSPDQVTVARHNAAAHGSWPSSDSVFVKDGVMTVVLAK